MSDPELKPALRKVIDWLDTEMNENPTQQLADTSNYLEEKYQEMDGETT